MSHAERSIAIRVEGIGKSYRLGRVANSYPTLRDTLAAAGSRLAKGLRDARKPAAAATFWALQDVSFEVARGDVVGIIGDNGAGKSTLLRILSRITEPTKGEAEIHGRLGSLLEVGTGFHQELTGRENIFLNGAILGMKRRDINRRFDEIVAFAEVERFIDTPVKYYSSGMYLRLAFAVAAYLKSDILLVDEVLAVGDAGFQRKCLGKMDSVARDGRTILFVSHNMIAVQALCERVIWLHEGKIVKEGRASETVSKYLASAYSGSTDHVWDDPISAPGNDKVRLRSARVRREDGLVHEPIDVRTDFLLEFEYWNLEPGTRLNLYIYLTNEQGILVFHAGALEQSSPLPVGLFRDVCHVPRDLMNDGVYRVAVEFQDKEVALYRHPAILTFGVLDNSERRGGWYGRWDGVIRPMLKWTTSAVDAEGSSARIRDDAV